MSAFTIFLIVVTIGYVLYYAAIITVDLNAKPKGEGSNEESVDTGGLVPDQPDDEQYDNQNNQEWNDDQEYQSEQEDADYSHDFNTYDEETEVCMDDEEGSQNQGTESSGDTESTEATEYSEAPATGVTPDLEEAPEVTETPEFPTDTDSVPELHEEPTVSEGVPDASPTIPEDNTDVTSEYVENDYQDSVEDGGTELTLEERAALLAEFQSSMEKDENINLVEPTVFESQDIFEDPEEDKYEVKGMYGPEDADEGDIPRAINATLEQTLPESTTPMDFGIIADAAMGRLGIEIDGTTHYERT